MNLIELIYDYSFCLKREGTWHLISLNRLSGTWWRKDIIPTSVFTEIELFPMSNDKNIPQTLDRIFAVRQMIERIKK